MNNLYKADLTKSTKENTYYSLAMFPYPSGAGLHVGHGTNFTANDIIARFKRMSGYTVINPMGWDSFGLPTENYAMKLGKPASEVTADNIARYKKQCEMMDRSYDWDREVATSDPSYYKRTQWIFQELYKAGLVYKKDAYVNRCPTDQTVLANDQVVDGCCERCGTEIIQKKHPQWFIKITDYADKLINDLDLVDRPEETKSQQKYWIGKSEGAEIDFAVAGGIAPETNIVILHGYHDDANAGWRKWLTDSCTAQGIVCYNPQCDHENGLSLEKDIDAIVAQCGDKITENTIIVGYSLGGLTAKHLITRLGKKVKKLITVASSFSRPATNRDLGDEALVAYRDTPLDHTKVEALVGEHIALFSKDDPAIEYALALSSWQKNYPQCAIRSFENKGHFNKHFGVTTLDEILPEIGLIKPITVFTTRPDTLFGVTALVLAPENASIDAYIPQEYSAALEEYRKVTSKKTSVERQQDAETKSGVFSGVYAIHPLTKKQVPIWFADYVLPDYATGAVMFVPAHDERDWAFAKKHGLDITQVVAPYYPAVLGEFKQKEGVEIVKRKLVTAIIKHPTDDTYMLLKHKNMNDSVGFPTGGVDEGEDIVQAAMREAQEELGYKNYTLLSSLDGRQVHSSFYAPHKDVNRYITQYAVVLQLENEEKGEVMKEKHDDFEMMRVKAEDVAKMQTRGNHLFLWEFYRNEAAYTSTGKLINSQQFDGLDNVDAKKAITDYLEQQGLGKKKITYKLRDWSVSRQRYWGSPIPAYYTFDSDEEVPFFMYTSGNKAFRPGLPIMPRNVIQCIVKDRNSDEYCFIKRAHDGDVSTMMGGIDDGEDAVVAAKRELLEEGGFTDLTLVKHLGEFHVQFYHPVKNRNQYSVNQVLYFETDKSKQGNPTDDEAKALHQTVWMKAADFLAITHNDTSVFIMNWLLTGDHGIKQKTPRYHAYNPHPNKDKRISHLIPTEQLPVVLPLDLGNYKPAGKSPLADHATFPYYVPQAAGDAVPYFEYHDEIRGVREGVESITRRIAQAVIKDPATGKYLALKWKVDNSVSFVAGGIEAGEDVIAGIMREITEETGYTDATYVKHLGNYQAYFYHPLKGHNQHSFGEVLYFELSQNAKQQPLEAKELEKHEPMWMTKEEFLAISNEPVNDYFIGVLEGKIPEHRVRVNPSNRSVSKKALLFHGRGNHNDDFSCLLGLQKSMYSAGYAIEYNTHDYEKKSAIDIYSLDAHASVVAGHSTGGYLAMKYAETHKVDTLIIIAPGISTNHMPEYFKTLAEKDFGKAGFATYQEFHKADIDHAKVQQNCTRIIFVFGAKDHIIKDEIVEYYKNAYADKAEFITLDLGHMGSLEDGADNIPEINALVPDTRPVGTYTYLRECDTLDTFMCSSFYFLRFVDPKNTKELISKELADKALPVDFYIGGKEHTYGHLLYSRFIHKFLFDRGYVSCSEPFQRLFHQGMVLGPDGRKMSKRWGNVITPEDLMKKYGEERGADVLRTYTMFMGPLEIEKAWNDNAVDGVKRFLDRAERVQEFVSADEKAETTIQLHKTIKGVSDDIEKLKFNTAVSKMMVFVNHIYEMKNITKGQLAIFLQLLAPFATKLTQEMRTKIGQDGSIHLSQWPQHDDSLIAEDTLSLPVQIGGKMRGTLDIKKGLSQDEVMTLVQGDERFTKYLDGATIKKIIYVQDKIVNVII